MFLTIVTLFITMQISLTSTEKANCNDIICAHIIDPVCGMSKYPGGTIVIRKYQNICHLTVAKCHMMAAGYVMKKIPDKICGINKPVYEINGRRAHDFSIVGAHQACNHTCPTYCVDTYEPACAEIWTPDMTSSVMRPMVNHCHVDLFSCAMALNVTIKPLSRCYKNSPQLMFMAHAAALKSLGLIGDVNSATPRVIKNPMKVALELG